MKRKLLLFFILIINLIAAGEIERPGREHKIYFANTPNELNVYKIYGRFEGNTVMILGGIQGDEPGAFLSADLYPNLTLETGNLIVIPRANFHSIITSLRGVNGDMNRRFISNQKPDDPEGQIVEIIKELMSECDVFLNLHDGWGFYSETWESEGRNPERFGQSIIADDSVFITAKDTLYLEKTARQVLANINRKIPNEKHHLHFLNTHSSANDPRYEGMNKSATYYALTHYNIPAFGIEASKNLGNLEDKIRYHNYAINEFMKLYGVEPEHPAIIYSPPKLVYLLVSINDSEPKLIDNEHTLRLVSGDKVRITHIESNYTRGLSCDIIGVGSAQDFGTPVIIDNSTKVIVRKDNHVIGNINIQVSEISAGQMAYIFDVNGRKQAILDEQTLTIRRGDVVTIVNVVQDGIPSEFLRVNLKGYVPPVNGNTGEDRGFAINSRDLQWKKYSVDGDGKVYPIIVYKNNRIISKAYIRIEG